jgi:hypothetical protein
MKTSNKLNESMLKQLDLIKKLNNELKFVKNENEKLKSLIKERNSNYKNLEDKLASSMITRSNNNNNNNNINNNKNYQNRLKYFNNNNNTNRYNKRNNRCVQNNSEEEQIRYLDYLIKRSNENYIRNIGNNKIDEFINSLIILVR